MLIVVFTLQFYVSLIELYSHENRLNILCDNTINIVKCLTREIKKLRHVADNKFFLSLYAILY